MIMAAAVGHPAVAQSFRNSTLDLPDEGGAGVGFHLPNEVSAGVDWEKYFASVPALRNMKLGIQMGGSKPLLMNSGKPMLPASTEKLITAGAALKFLGPEHRFENSFHADLSSDAASISNVQFKVSGDPTWDNGDYSFNEEQPSLVSPSRLDRVVDLLAAKGVKKVTGAISIEAIHPELDSIPRPAGWKTSWALECMAMMQTSFESNGNCGTVVISSTTRAGWSTPGVTVPIRLSLTRSRYRASSIRVTPSYDSTGRISAYKFSGVLGRYGASYDLPVHQGPSWLKSQFVQKLQSRGIQYLEKALPTSTSAESLDVDLSSDRLINILTTAVQRSLNGVMDRIFAELEIQQKLSAAEVASRYFESLVQDQSMLNGVRMEDGCGLDLRNQMRPDALYRFLDKIRGESYFVDFFSTLAVAGQSGTLRTRATLINSNFTNKKIFAKTGTLTGVTNLAGYFMIPGSVIEPFVVLSDSSYGADQARPLVDGAVVNFAAQNTPSGFRLGVHSVDATDERM
jgi:D-alanyl-D-alanine carboxypeptidase/D-alanyl-D-alanine-endopeptidase (penicillin-binding protein 4)